MRTSHILKALGVLALTTTALMNAANAGERSPGLTGPGVAVNPGNSTAVMQGYQQQKTVPQMRPQHVPPTRLHRTCPDNWFWNGWKCTPLFKGGKIGR